MRLFAQADYPFLQWRRQAYILTGIVLLTCFAAMGYHTVRDGSWLNYGVDFAGGTVIQVDFAQPISVEQIRSAATAAGQRWDITRFGGGGDEFVIRTAAFEGTEGRDAGQVVRGILAQRFPQGSYDVVRTEAVGPRAGADLQRQALFAILASFALTLAYIAVRFEWRFGIAAVIATAHDLLVTLGLLSILWNEVSLGTVAAVLTIVGYSLNDTIIVFDRIRENLARSVRRVDYAEVLSRSINETLPRTVLTTGTTLITLFSLYMFGGGVIRIFAQVLIFGIAIGTFSSVFIAAPALYEIERRWPRQAKAPARSAGAAPSRVSSSV
ncbi:MAG: protein translocase subunit SecF [Gemmatimonadota bacterium]|jgi:preprotein translocase subunit SecF|nr:protein translocase subunit SecF [Gemmatimonadota bacterium]